MKMKKLVIISLAATLSIGGAFAASAGWVSEGSNWKYQNENNTYQAGQWFKDANNTWYHFDQNGTMQRGWLLDNGQWYFMAYSGAMQSGLIEVDGNVYFLNPSGEVFVGEKAVNGVTYQFGINGTTNGKPTVESKGWSGNGNQTALPSGSNNNSNTSSTPTTKEEKVDAINEKVASKVNEVNAIEGLTASFEDKTVTVATTEAEATEIKAAELKSAVVTVVSETIKMADDNSEAVIELPNGLPVVAKKVSDGVIQIGEKKASVDVWFDTYIGEKKIAELKGSSSVTVVINGETVTYDVVLNMN